MENKFITDVIGMIKNKSAKKQIQAELESHILDKADYYKEIGYSQEEAMQKATEEMGDPEETAVPLNNLHNRKWYKTPANYIAVIVFILLVVLCNLFSSQLYDFSYISLSFPNSTPHFILLDFISTAFFALYMFSLHYARKHNNLFIPVLALIFLFQRFGYELGTVTLFQPMVYSLVFILTRGFAGYSDNIFNYSYIPETYSSLSEFCVTVFVFTIIIYASIVFVYVCRKRYSLANLKSRRYRTFETIINVFIALNFVVMSVCTAVAYSNIDNKIEEANQSRADMIDLVLYLEDNKDKIAEVELYDVLSQTGFDFEETHPFMYKAVDCNSEMITYLSSYTNYITAEYELTNIQKPYGFLADDLSFSEAEFSAYGFDIRTDKVNNITLDEFLGYGIHHKACCVRLPEYTDKTYDIAFVFLIEAENSDDIFFHINFKDDVCTDYYISNDYNERSDR